MTKKLLRLNSLWVGPRVGYLEQLSMQSALSVGHPFTVYSYTPDELCGLPTGVQLKDAREVMPEARLLRYSDSGAISLGSNFFRYELLKKGLGYWVDLDVYFLKPLDFVEDHVFGWEYENWINGAIFYARPDSAFLGDLLNLPSNNTCPQWFGPRRRMKYYWRRLTEGNIRIEDLPWGTYSSQMITWAAKKHRVANQAKSPDVFYPIRWKDAASVYGPAEIVEASITPNTRTVHLWNSRLVQFFNAPPSAGSFIYQACSKLNIDTSSSKSHQ